MVERHATSAGFVDIARAWSMDEVGREVRELLEPHTGSLPADRGAHIVLKPNLNNDLVALTGNCTDLRVLTALVEALQDLGYLHLTIADGPNVGVERRGIDVFARLRVDRLARRYGVDLVDLNRAPGTAVALHAGAAPAVAALIQEADLLVSVPTVKTHAEMGFSSACKNHVGIARGQDKRQVHYALDQNIAALVQRFPPDLVLVDGLVGMEGNGPGDGEPFRLGRLFLSDSPWLSDLAVCRTVDLPWRRVPYLLRGLQAGCFSEADASDIAASVAVVRPMEPAPARSLLAVLSERRWLLPLKLAVRPLVARPAVAELAYRAGIVQDVYDLEDDGVTGVRRVRDDCSGCDRCSQVCPTRLTVEEVGVRVDADACIGCLYCWWVCLDGALELVGPLRGMERQVRRYKGAVEGL